MSDHARVATHGGKACSRDLLVRIIILGLIRVHKSSYGPGEQRCSGNVQTYVKDNLTWIETDKKLLYAYRHRQYRCSSVPAPVPLASCCCSHWAPDRPHQTCCETGAPPRMHSMGQLQGSSPVLCEDRNSTLPR
eukprot:scaffold268749_cov17-Tisochrysis_lutea.AAC.1